MLVIKCDICGREISDDEPARKIHAEWDKAIDFYIDSDTNTLSFGHDEKQYDLCSDCYHTLFDFMKAFKEDPFIKVVHIDEEDFA